MVNRHRSIRSWDAVLTCRLLLMSGSGIILPGQTSTPPSKINQHEAGQRGNEHHQQSVRDHETLKSFHGIHPISVTRSLLFNPGDRPQTEPASRGCSYQSTEAPQEIGADMKYHLNPRMSFNNSGSLMWFIACFVDFIK